MQPHHTVDWRTLPTGSAPHPSAISSSVPFGHWNTMVGLLGRGEGGKQLSLHWSCGHPLFAVGEAPLICLQDLPRAHLPPPGLKGPCSICRMGAPSVEWSPLLQPPQPQDPCSWLVQLAPRIKCVTSREQEPSQTCGRLSIFRHLLRAWELVDMCGG